MTRISTILVILAALCWGLSGGIGSMLMEEGWGVFLVAFYRGAIGLLFVLAWLCVRPLNHGLGDRRLWGWPLLWPWWSR